MTLVFVYGSLKKGFSNHSLLNSSRFIRSDTTQYDYGMVSLGGFPGVMKANVIKHYCKDARFPLIYIGKIAGELYEVDDNTLDRLDGLEGNGYFYNRELILTTTEKAWMYFLIRYDGDTFIPHKDGIISWEFHRRD